MRKLNLFRYIFAMSAALLVAAGNHAFSQSPNIGISVDDPVITELDNAMQLTHAGDRSNRIFIAERAGVIKAFLPAAPATALVFLNMNNPATIVDTEGEGGLLSIAFHPNFETNGYFYTYYTDLAGDLVIARYTASGNQASSASYLQILKIPHPNQTNHNGGELHFGKDGFLYLSTGDGGGANDGPNNGQNPTSLLGKILRIDVNVPEGAAQPYAIPETNPIPNSPVFAVGLRNPFRWSFDRLTGDMWIGDVGQGAREEVNFRAAGSISNANFGWRCYEGDIPTPGISQAGCQEPDFYARPIYTYETGDLRGKSVIGGVVYRGTKWPLMSGYYIGTDYFSGDVHKILRSQSYAGFETGQLAGTVDIGEDEAGEIYAVKSGAVYQIYAEQPLPVNLVNFKGEKGNEGIRLTWNTSMEAVFSRFEVEFSLNAKSFETVGTVVGQNAAAGSDYLFSHITKTTGMLYYRLKMIDTDESFEHSRIITVDADAGETAGMYVRPTVISSRALNLVLDRPFQSVELVNASGQVFLKEELSGKSGAVAIPLHDAAAGLYVVRLADQDEVVQQRVLITD